MTGRKLFSADTHAIEPPNLWLDYIEPRFKDRAPRVRREENGDQWYADGAKFGSFGAVSQPGVRFDDPRKVTLSGTQDQIRPGAYDPHAHVKDMDADGISGDVIYPTQSLSLYNLKDSALISASCRAYCGWIADFCKTYPNRLRGIGIVNVDNPEEAAADVQRAAKLGLAGMLVPLQTIGERYDHPTFYEPLYAAAQDSGLPLILHTAAFRGSQDASDAVDHAVRDSRMRMACAAFLLGRVFERYPRLKLGVVEFELGWFPYFSWRVDQVYTDRRAGLKIERFSNGALPSDHARRNMFITFQEDRGGIEMRHLVGIENILWGSDYPHAEGSFPKSREIVERTLQGVPENEKEQILWKNTARIFRLD
jgi:predicted TIM-barrel fold metal-dependent hydrolase